jgi:hypothetical protein
MLLILLIVLTLVTLVGHGIWVLLAWLFGALAAAEPAEPPVAAIDRRRRCPQCHRLLLPGQATCAVCDPQSVGRAAELKDLEATARQTARFREDGTLDPALGERVLALVEARRRHLTEPPPIPQPAVKPEEAPHPLWQQLGLLLEACKDARNLTPAQQERALSLYRQVDAAQVAQLSAGAQLVLARLCRMAYQPGEALRTYRQLLERYPEDATFARTALEAGQFASGQKEVDQAIWFLEKALSGSLSPEQRRQAERLLYSLRPPVAEEIPEVLPALESKEKEGVHTAAATAVLTPPRDEGAQAFTPAPSLTPPRAPRRSLAEVLAAFMEERNIFWGELVGGLLMVGCSIALVIYLWKDLERIPYFQFLIFVSTTAALFGTGLYALHRLKLATTSRGLLVIATLLIPLNFVVMAGLAGQEAEAELSRTVFRIGTEVLSLAIFAGLMLPTARVLVPEGRGSLILAVLGISVSQLVVPRLLQHGQDAPGALMLLGCLPIAFYGTTAAHFLYGASRRRPFDAPQARALFAFLGLVTFSLAVALGFLAYWRGEADVALQQLAVHLAVAGVPVLAGGILVHRGLAEAPDANTGPTASLRTAGTAIALAGMAIMLAAVGLAWPRPVPLILVCGLNFVVLTAAAFLYRLPVAHAVALACLAVGYLTGFHLIAEHLAGPEEELGARLLSQASSATSGSALLFLVVLVGIAAEFLVRAGQRPHAIFYAIGSGLLALVSLTLVNLRGLADPATAAVVTGIYAVGGLTMNLRWQRPVVSYLGLALVLVTTLWALWWHTPALTPRWGTLLAVEALMMATVAVNRPAPSLIPAAWRDLAALAGALAVFLALRTISDSALHTATAGTLAATAFLLAWAYRAAPLTWAGSALVLVGLFHTFGWSVPGLNRDHAAVLALLTHATLVLPVGLMLRAKDKSTPSLSLAVTVGQQVFAEPLCHSAFVSTLFVLPVLCIETWDQTVASAVYTGWLSTVWLVIAWTSRRPLMFSAFQAALTLSVLLATTAWLERQPWISLVGFSPLVHLRSLHIYGIGLGLLELLWLGTRLTLRENPVAQRLFEPPWPAVDRMVFRTVVLGQLGLAIWGIAPGIERELTPLGTEPLRASLVGFSAADGPGAWALLVVLAVGLIVALWDRQRMSTVFGLVILAITAAVLAAGPFERELATASALRWTLGICFFTCSVPLWCRTPLARLAKRLGCAPEPAPGQSAQYRWLLLAFMVAPVLLLTTVVASMAFDGQTPSGPLPDSFFGRLGWITTNVMPLVFVSLGLVGHALRERSAPYAFAAGLVVDAAVMGGYALGIVTAGQAFGPEQWGLLLQLGTVTASLWDLAWLASRPWTAAWREGPDTPLAAPLMTLQLGLGVVGNTWLLITALWLLAMDFPDQAAWTVQVGSPLGWLSLVLTTVALGWRRRQQGLALHPHAFGLLGMTAVSLLACSVAGTWPEWAYRTLMLGWAALPAALVLAGWLRERQGGKAVAGEQSAGPLAHPLAPEYVTFWVRVSSLLAILLGLKAAVVHHDHLWAAAAITLASVAGAAVAAWRHREGWAFAAGLGVNLAASLVVWHHHLEMPAADWWIALVQANVLASAAVALLWLGARKWLYEGRELRLATSPFLAAQLMLAVSGNLVLLLGPLAQLVANPGEGWPPALAEVGNLWGWLALALPAAAAFWYTNRVAPRSRGHVLVAFGLALGVLAACSAGRGAELESWLTYHVLTAAWTGIGLVILAAEHVAQLRDSEDGDFSPFPQLALLVRFSAAHFRAWLNGVGMLVLGLALRGTWADPARPYWSAVATLAVSAMAGAVALRSRQILYTYISGLLVSVAGGIAWVAWGSSTALSFGYTQVLCLAVAAGLWTVLESVWAQIWLTSSPSTPDAKKSSPGRREPGTEVPPFRHAAAVLGTSLLVLLVAVGVFSDLTDGSVKETGHLPWLALGATTVALALSLWDRSALFTLGALYAIGLSAIGLGLHVASLEPPWYTWAAAPALAAYVLLTTLLGWAAPRLPEPWRRLRLPARPTAWPEAWFPPAQVAVASVAGMLSMWISLTFDTPAHRLAGCLVALVLLLAGVVFSGTTPGRWAAGLRYGTLALGVVAVVEAGWAMLDPVGTNLGLYRGVVLMTALALMTLLYGLGLPRLLPPLSVWITCARRTGPVLGALASVTLLMVLAQEGLLYNPAVNRTPMDPLAIAVVLLALVGLIAAAVCFAAVPGRDPFGLSERSRKLYVYSAEVLLFLLFVHTRLTIPELFGGQLGKYWPLIVMAVAFLGVGLSEFFARKGLPVLAEPLQRTGIFLPVLPLLAFWTRPPVAVEEFAQLHFPGLQPMLRYLQGREQDFGKYALLWFLLGALYTVVGVTRRSYRFALLAALAANFGLWCLLREGGLSFLSHPQLWLVPFAVIVLVAENLNRDRLGEAQAAALRYVGLLVIYISSTADMFLAGLGQSVIWPLVLAVLSIAGVLAGIVLRVRAFLYLGVTFLFVVVFSMIWHAAVGEHQVWVWWTSGIVLGAAIITLFAIFEKRRNDVLRVLEEMKKWS